MTLKHILIALTLLLISASAISDIYQYRDANGKLHFTDSPPENSDAKTVTIKPNIKGYKAAYKNLPEASTTNKVIMYSTSWCGYCRKARKYFQANNIAFIEKDIEKNSKAKRAYDKYKGSGVPLIVYAGKHMRGFSQQRFQSLYQSASRN